jgi:hypothetical protein
LLLQARLAISRGNFKYARNILRRLISTFTSADAPAYVYCAHLTLVDCYLKTSRDLSKPPASYEFPTCRQDLHSALDEIQALQDIAQIKRHTSVVLLACIIRLGVLVSHGLWDLVQSVIQATEGALGLSYDAATHNARDAEVSGYDISASMIGSNSETSRNAENFIAFEDSFESLIAIHMLISSIIYYTRIGESTQAKPRLSHLHSLLDSGALDTFQNGTIEVFIRSVTPVTPGSHVL